MSCPTGPFIPEHLKRPPLKAAVLRERPLWLGCEQLTTHEGTSEVAQVMAAGGGSQHVGSSPDGPLWQRSGDFSCWGGRFLSMSGLKPEWPDGFSHSVAMENRPVVGKPNKGHLCFRGMSHAG